MKTTCCQVEAAPPSATTGNSNSFCIAYRDRLWRTKTWGLTPNPHHAHFWRSEAEAKRAEHRAQNPDASLPTMLFWLFVGMAWVALILLLCIPSWRAAVWKALTS